MNPKETQHAINVMYAFVRGKEIQFSVKGSGVWLGASAPHWDWDECEFRVKPQPMEIELWVSPDGLIGRQVEKDDKILNTEWTKKRFREVLP